MAQLIITIPDEQIPRIIAAFNHLLKEGDAVDLENPTGLEIKEKLEAITRQRILDMVLRYEHQKTINDFVFEDLSIT